MKQTTGRDQIVISPTPGRATFPERSLDDFHVKLMWRFGIVGCKVFGVFSGVGKGQLSIHYVPGVLGLGSSKRGYERSQRAAAEDSRLRNSESLQKLHCMCLGNYSNDFRR
jgi:hypothetical protein